MKFINNVKELTSSSGVGDLVLEGAVTGFASAASQLAPGDRSVWRIADDFAWEISVATYGISPDRISGRVCIASSTGTLIPWPSSGQREVSCVLPGEFITSLFDYDAQTPGFLARIGAFAFASRALQDGDFVSVLNRDGVAGDPEIDDSGLPTDFLRRNVAASMIAMLTMAGGSKLVLDYFAANDLVIGGLGGEDLLKIHFAAALDYVASLRVGGAWRRLLTANAADKNDADLLTGSTQAQLRTAFWTPSWSSGPQAISSNGVLALTHSLGVEPRLVRWQLKCAIADTPFIVGTVIPGESLLSYPTGPAGRGHFATVDATHLNVYFGDSGGGLYVVKNVTGTHSEFILTDAKWTIEFFLYA